jgi:subtilase family serine protease
LVEARSSSVADLLAGVDTAAAMGAGAISNSYGAGEFSAERTATYDGHLNHPGVAITASSGDNGYGVEFPAASEYVTAVGGTRLSYNRSTGARSETAWSGAGSGCSAYIAQPTWQAGLGSCPRRTVADVAAVADPATGVAVYDSYGSSGGANWYVFGGTSVASPIVASVYALAGTTGAVAGGTRYNSVPYAHRSSLFDVVSGSNGHCGTSTYLCTARTGYDGPTGLGTPNGLDAF